MCFSRLHQFDKRKKQQNFGTYGTTRLIYPQGLNREVKVLITGMVPLTQSHTTVVIGLTQT